MNVRRPVIGVIAAVALAGGLLRTEPAVDDASAAQTRWGWAAYLVLFASALPVCPMGNKKNPEISECIRCKRC